MPLPYTTPAQLKQLEKQVENLRQQGSEIGGDTEIAITVDDYIHLPELPEDAGTKTYQLKAVNGTLTWVE